MRGAATVGRRITNPMKSLALLLSTAVAPALCAASFPTCGNVVDVTKPPYSGRLPEP